LGEQPPGRTDGRRGLNSNFILFDQVAEHGLSLLRRQEISEQAEREA
jgi:hypothetical protein